MENTELILNTNGYINWASENYLYVVFEDENGKTEVRIPTCTFDPKNQFKRGDNFILIVSRSPGKPDDLDALYTKEEFRKFQEKFESDRNTV